MTMTPENYKSERIKRGLSQAALAALVGVSRGCINYREAGHPRYPITPEAWLAICSLPVAKPKRTRKAKGQNDTAHTQTGRERVPDNTQDYDHQQTH
jgi:DNA-binding XRE family transcriptional regulator